MKKHASNSEQAPARSAVRTPGSHSLLRFKRQISGLLTVAAAIVATLGLSSCVGVTGAPAGSKAASSDTVGSGVLSPASSSLSFGNVAVGSSATQSVIVTNTGTASVNVSQAIVSGSGFVVLSGNSPATVGVGQSITVQVQFQPQATGTASGSLSVSSNAAPVSIALSGTGTQGMMAITPGSLSFNNIVAGQTSTQGVTLTNNGNASITVTAARVSGTGFTSGNAASWTERRIQRAIHTDVNERGKWERQSYG